MEIPLSEIIISDRFMGIGFDHPGGTINFHWWWSIILLYGNVNLSNVEFSLDLLKGDIEKKLCSFPQAIRVVLRVRWSYFIRDWIGMG